jgi:SAM-dependent MidA family methyltransferase
VQLVEAGAHDGRLAADILRWLRLARPEQFARLKYVISEPSPRRRAWQRRALAEFDGRVSWLENDESFAAARIAGVIFSNELLDAMPVHRLGWDRERRDWFEWGVALSGAQFAWARMELKSSLRERLPTCPAELREVLPDGFTIELGPAAESWWQQASGVLQRGYLVTLDYGLTAAEIWAPGRHRGTLRSYRQHRVSDDVLAAPGEQDLTAQVDFAAIQRAGERAGLRTERCSMQAEFLLEIVKRFWPEAEQAGRWTSARNRELQTLIHPEHLGRAFRVLVQSRGAWGGTDSKSGLPQPQMA